MFSFKTIDVENVNKEKVILNITKKWKIKAFKFWKDSLKVNKYKA